MKLKCSECGKVKKSHEFDVQLHTYGRNSTYRFDPMCEMCKNGYEKHRFMDTQRDAKRKRRGRR